MIQPLFQARLRFSAAWNLARWAALASMICLFGCDTIPPSPLPQKSDATSLEGLWAGIDDVGQEQHLLCLKLVEPDSAAAFEMVAVDTLEGSGLIAAAEGRWSYRPPRVEVQLFAWPDPRGVPRITAELSSTTRMLLLRVAYRQGDQLIAALTPATRCGRFRAVVE